MQNNTMQQRHTIRRRAPFGRVDENMATMCVARDKQSSGMAKSEGSSVKKSMFHVFGKKKLQQFSASSITQQGSDASSNDVSLIRALQQDEAYTTSMSIFRSEERDASNIDATSLELMLLSRARPIREDSIGMTSEASYCLRDDFLDDDDFQQFFYGESDDDKSSSSSSVAIMLSWQDAVEDEIVF